METTRKHTFKRVFVKAGTSNIKRLDEIKPIYSLGEFKKAYMSYKAQIDSERDNIIIPSTLRAINTLLAFEKHRKVLLMS